MHKGELELARRKWIKRVVLTFLLAVAILIGTDKALKAFEMPDIYLKILFLVFGAIYLIQIFSYRNIRCRKCGSSIFTQYSIFFSTPTECRHCKTVIES